MTISIKYKNWGDSSAEFGMEFHGGCVSLIGNGGEEQLVLLMTDGQINRWRFTAIKTSVPFQPVSGKTLVQRQVITDLPYKSGPTDEECPMLLMHVIFDWLRGPIKSNSLTKKEQAKLEKKVRKIVSIIAEVFEFEQPIPKKMPKLPASFKPVKVWR